MHQFGSIVLMGIAALLATSSALAQEYRYRLYVDRDVTATTGCTESVGATTFGGAELRISAYVTGTTVTSVTFAQCSGTAFGTEGATGGPHSVGLNNGVNGSDVIEFAIDRQLLGQRNAVQLALSGSNSEGTTIDALTTQPGGGGVLQGLAPTMIPTLGVFGVMLLISALFFLALRRLKLGAVSIGALLIAGSVWAAHFIVDGDVQDWAGVIALAPDPANDATGSDPGADLIRLYGVEDNDRMLYRIDVRDVENQLPVALAQSLTFDEDSGANAITLTATDGDSDPLTYAIVTNPTKGVLSGLVPSTGAVTYTPNLNAEGADGFTFTAIDALGASNPATISILLTPVNDAPVTNDVTFSITENTPNGAFVGTPIVATDPDTTAPNNTLSYAITAGNTNAAFAIDAITGQISVNNSAQLDFKLNTSFLLTVAVSDAAVPPSADTAAVAVNLINVNEPPMLQGEPYVFSLPENSELGTVIGQAPAVDPDTIAPNNTLTWAVTSGNASSAFAINATTGEITVASTAPLDFETTPSFTLGISVSDGGTPQGSDTSSVSINVSDVNEAPVVIGSTFSVPENSTNGTLVGTVTATDVDLPPQTLTWAITAGNGGGEFMIDANGAITVTNSSLLDFETTPTFTLMVQGTDNGTPSLSGTATVTVNLTNVNEAPVFQAEPYAAIVAENTPNGTTVTSVVTATDVDSSATLTYAIIGGNTSAAFAIAPATGVITVANSAAVDVEVNPSFTLNLSVTDNGVPTLSDTSSIVITVDDVNEAPVFQSEPYAFSVAENSAPATAVGITPATDQDLPAQTLTYAITGGNTGGTFAIGAGGAITVAVSPNFEVTPSYTLAISVTDNGAGALSDTSTVAITITNVNEAPVNTVPGAQTTGVSVPLGFNTGNGNAISVADVDAATGAVTTTISTTLGTFSATAVGGALVTGSGTNSVAITDIVADVNATLQTLSFTSASGGTATVTVLTNDNGNTGTGGVQTDSDPITINIDTAPTVTATTPSNAATGVAVTSNVDVTFSEPVTVVGGWFQLVCPISGTRTTANAAVSGGPTTYTINPNVDFSQGETCVLTVFAAQINDNDAVDPPQNMPADFTSNFTTVDAAPTYTGGTASGPIANNATITINFSESVNIAAGGIVWGCSTFTPALPQNGVTTITLTPTGTLPSGPCNVTLESTLITDADLVDPPNQLDGDSSGDVIDGDADDRVITYTVDAAPSVTAVSPLNNATAVAITSNVDVTFSEAVSVVGSWFQIVCPISGTRTTANTVVSGGPTTFTINPTVDFSQGENCVLTVFAAQINDNDVVDPPQNLAADFTSNFTTVDLAPTRTTGTAPGTIANNATITLNFSESVNIAAGGITWACSAFTPALPQNGVTTITLTPTGTLPNGAACNVTLESTLITDADAVDPPNQLDGDNSGDIIDGDADDQVIVYTVDAAPAFSTSTPTSGAINVLPGANILVNFSEAVDVTVASFTIDCGTGSLAYAISGSGTTAITLNPNVDLLGGTVCTVTGVPASINDSDTVDPPANPAAFNFSFTVASIANDDAYPVTRHLTLSAPAAAELDANDQIGGGTITGFGTTLGTANGTAPGATIDDGANGTFTMNANGTFTFFPPANPAGATTDFFYTVTGGDTASITFTYQSELVWFIDNTPTSPTCTGDNVGTQACPATTTAAVTAVDTANDTIFVASGAYTGQTALEAGERLIGDGSSSNLATLTGITSVTGSSFPAFSGTPPVMSTGSLSDCVVLGTGNTIRGVTIANCGGAGGDSSDINGTGFGTLTVAETTLNGTGRALRLTTGTLSGSFIDIDVTAATGEGIALNAVGGTWSVANQLNFGNTGSNGIDIRNAPAATNLTFTGGTVVAKTSAGAAVLLDTNNSGASINLGSITLSNTNGTAFSSNASPVTITGTASTLNATNGPALTATATTFNAGVTFATVNSTTSATQGVNLVTVTGGVTINAGAINSATGTDFVINGGAANVTYAGTITDDLGQLISIQNSTGGTKLFSGAITDGNDGDGSGISLTNNTGAIMTFTGGIALSTGANAAFTATGPGPAATSGGTVNVTGLNTLASTTGTTLNVAHTTIGASGLTFRSISANGAVNGILLNNTGASAGLTVAGNGGVCSSAATCTGGAIQNTTGAGVLLANTVSPSFTHLAIQNTSGSGIEGTGVASFTLQTSFIDNSGTGGGADDSNLAFDSQALGTETNLSGVVFIDGNTLTNARYHGVRILNFNGTISNLVVSSNTITSSTAIASSLGSGIHIQAIGSTSTIAQITRGSITNNAITNFPSDAGVEVKGGNSTATGPGGTMGIPGDVTNVINITGNSIRGQSAANRMGTSFIDIGISGGNNASRSRSNFNISNNGTAGTPLAHSAGIGIGLGNTGFATSTVTMNNNFLTPNNTVASAGIGGGNGVVSNTTETPDLEWTISNNSISQSDGNGILAVARAINGLMKVKIQNNTVGAPLSGVRPGIRVDAGNNSVVGTGPEDAAVCLNISGNTSAGSGGTQGVGLRKQGVVATTNDFGVHNLPGGSTATPNLEAFVNGLNPAGGGTLLISATSGFSTCNLP